MALLIYTDGACKGNPGPGGWAWFEPATAAFDSGGDPMTTNQRMELMAVLQALQSHAGDLMIRSDSTYVVNCFRQAWWKKWEANGFKTSRGDAVANGDLWRPLLAEALHAGRHVTFEWVKGHSSDPHNNRVDVLAQEAAGRFQ
ncbi:MULTISPECIES: ribonuclease H family protein [Ferrimicrobium]|uniref:ribonuclease H family protein n=1 Tax=Ferrimicrobium TaxID=121038 RepID=UPI0023F01108|nr:MULTISPECIES: ribonuclease H [Ferrimicrobium]